MTSSAPAPATLPVSEPVVARTNRLEALTGIRILAALAVYLSHTGLPPGRPQMLDTFLASGYMGVTVFFVLSGFVLALNYFDGLRRPTGRKLWSYAVARVARVYPLYLLALAYMALLVHGQGNPVDGWVWHALALQAWSPNAAFAFAFNGPAWSVSVEFLLYACFPLLVLAIARLRSVRSLAAAAAGVAVALLTLAAWFAISGQSDLPLIDPDSAHRWLYRAPVTRLLDFALGILAARLYLELRHARAWQRLGGALAVAAGLAILALMAWPAHLHSAWSWDASYAIPAAVLIFGLAIAPTALLARALALPLVVLLGEASYAFYLVHVPLIDSFGARQWPLGAGAAGIAYQLMTLGLVLAAAVGLHVMVETPARTWIRKLARRPAPGA